jgi:hypothetical protein
MTTLRWSVLTLRIRSTYSFVVFLARLLSPTFGLTVLLWRSVLLIVLLRQAHEAGTCNSGCVGPAVAEA